MHYHSRPWAPSRIGPVSCIGPRSHYGIHGVRVGVIRRRMKGSTCSLNGFGTRYKGLQGLCGASCLYTKKSGFAGKS